MESKMQNSTHSFRKRTLCFSSYKNSKLKVKLWWVGPREWNKRKFFVPFIVREKNFFLTFVLSQCIVFWIHFHTIHIFTYQKILLNTVFYLFLKSSKDFSVSLKQLRNLTYYYKKIIFGDILQRISSFFNFIFYLWYFGRPSSSRKTMMILGTS